MLLCRPPVVAAKRRPRSKSVEVEREQRQYKGRSPVAWELRPMIEAGEAGMWEAPTGQGVVPAPPRIVGSYSSSTKVTSRLTL
jgi:hypothetical protein